MFTCHRRVPPAPALDHSWEWPLPLYNNAAALTIHKYSALVSPSRQGQLQPSCSLSSYAVGCGEANKYPCLPSIFRSSGASDSLPLHTCSSRSQAARVRGK